MKRSVGCMLLALFLLVATGSGLADPNLMIQDTAVRAGAWATVYGQILEEHRAAIEEYQEYVSSVTSGSECRPVGWADLTGDGTPELLFVENVHNTEYGFELGRMWIYTADGNGAHCALTLQPEIDDLLFSTLYLGADGLLTIHLSDMEMGWTLQFRMAADSRYAMETELVSQEDFSGEGPDQYFLNGREITAKAYQQTLKDIQSVMGTKIGSFLEEDSFRGFSYTAEEAMTALRSGVIAEIPQAQPENSGTENDSPSEELLPTLTFFPGEFTEGQKFAVYSAPSSKSFRSAKGKAAITSGSEIFVAGTVDGWLLIQYELDSGVTRVGYVNQKIISGPYSAGSEIALAAVRMTLTESAEMTDDPVRQMSMIGKLKKGAKVTALAEYMGWIYAETKVSGKTARGFIAPESLEIDAQ